MIIFFPDETWFELTGLRSNIIILSDDLLLNCVGDSVDWSVSLGRPRSYFVNRYKNFSLFDGNNCKFECLQLFFLNSEEIPTLDDVNAILTFQ